MKAFCTLTVRTLLKLPVRSRQMKFNMPKAKFSWCFYKRTSFRTVSESYLILFVHTLDSLWNVVKSVSVWFPQSPWQSHPAPVHMCEDTSEDDRVPSVRHVACNQSDSRLVCISTGQREFDHTHIKVHSGLFSKRLSSSSVKVNLWFINQHRLNIVQTCHEIMCVISALIQAVLQHLHQFELH